MAESILPFTTHSTDIQHESFTAALSVFEETDTVRLLHAHKLRHFHYRCLHGKIKIFSILQTALLKELATY